MVYKGVHWQLLGESTLHSGKHISWRGDRLGRGFFLCEKEQITCNFANVTAKVEIHFKV